MPKRPATEEEKNELLERLLLTVSPQPDREILRGWIDQADIQVTEGISKGSKTPWKAMFASWKLEREQYRVLGDYFSWYGGEFRKSLMPTDEKLNDLSQAVNKALNSPEIQQMLVDLEKDAQARSPRKKPRQKNRKS